ncbi:MAG: J domain-containing protein, partial [Leptolyngbyaceae cyanobacterium RU_5_1]|nr:J domain-containing protein [Leptolyngbyaceae cyanobacterium RU_5_1]
MTSPHDRLGISPTATPDEIKAAYHAKLREFPAHRHPEEFKAIRAAYDAIRKGDTASADDFFFLVRPLEATIDPAVVQQLRQRVVSQLNVSLEELIRETFITPLLPS